MLWWRGKNEKERKGKVGKEGMIGFLGKKRGKRRRGVFLPQTFFLGKRFKEEWKKKKKKIQQVQRGMENKRKTCCFVVAMWSCEKEAVRKREFRGRIF